MIKSIKYVNLNDMTEIVAAINEIKIIGKPKINDNKKKDLKLAQFIILSVEIKIKDSN